VPAALIIATSHRGCAAEAHPQHQIRVLPGDRLHVGPADVGEPPQTGLTRQHATQRLLRSSTPRVHQPPGYPYLVRPRALTARRHRRAPHGEWHPTEGGPFEPRPRRNVGQDGGLSLHPIVTLRPRPTDVRSSDAEAESAGTSAPLAGWEVRREALIPRPRLREFDRGMRSQYPAQPVPCPKGLRRRPWSPSAR